MQHAAQAAETAAHLVDHVLPPLPVRQWVLSLPKRLRYHLQRDRKALNCALRIFLDEIERHLRAQSPGAGPDARAGAVAFIHRFGSSLNLHTHFHVCVIDEELDRHRLIYHLPAPGPHGRKQLILSPLELVQRLAALVPPPRMHRHRYYGVLAPNAPLRAAVTSLAPEALATQPAAPVQVLSARPPRPAGAGVRIRSARELVSRASAAVEFSVARFPRAAMSPG